MDDHETTKKVIIVGVGASLPPTPEDGIVIGVVPARWCDGLQEATSAEERWNASARGLWRYEQAQRLLEGLPALTYETWYLVRVEPALAVVNAHAAAQEQEDSG